ncbi:hypothetical protein ASD22_11015 [Rhodanobacter sp. Root480]|uniref:hypothetical protein n=1 Tax=Rhodanobacter sp. Root480 TaxID=1736542 RepID=UPI000701DF9A|nr:hypothetical protein [Rhodanobacter sp. Root480]KQX97744.1 hypothetical protein ASD22_11015 [Rhodanobacter sp. Root480]
MNAMDRHPKLHSQTPAIEVIRLFSPHARALHGRGGAMNKLVMTNNRTHLFSEVGHDRFQ